jgi:hypothetical protein
MKWEDWDAQHGPLRMIGPPYVYNVKAGNATVLEEALRMAMENPIGRYIRDYDSLFSLKPRILTCY